jgi:hypothetical protein
MPEPELLVDLEELEHAEHLITRLVINADVQIKAFEQRVENRLNAQIQELRTENRILAGGVILALIVGLVRCT